jgi:chloride channel protein, CIC family
MLYPQEQARCRMRLERRAGCSRPRWCWGRNSGFSLAQPAGLLPYLDVQPEGFAIVGMAAFFAGVVRAPITGIVLATEMTGNVSMLLPMLCACAVAMLVPTLFGDPPIYESLRERALPVDKLVAKSGDA